MTGTWYCEVLGEAGILSAAQQEAIVRIAKFRNVDPEIVVRILREHLGDFAGFRAAVLGSVSGAS